MGAYQLDAQELYAHDREWELKQQPHVQAILQGLFIRPATFVLDTKEATDWNVLNVRGGESRGRPINAIATRVRRPNNFWQRTFGLPVYWGQEFTLRLRRDNGVKTEWHKVMKDGFGDLLLYAHVQRERILHWGAYDLEVFRAHESRASFIDRDNHDGTHFRAYRIDSFPDEIVWAASRTIRFMLDHGIDALKEKIDELVEEDIKTYPILIEQRREPVGPQCHCGMPGVFGYKDQRSNMFWYCEEHRLAQWWADARRDPRQPVIR